MSNNKLNILLTRPLEKSQKLAKELQPLANNIEITPLFAYQKGINHSLLKQQINDFKPQIIIFISQAAVKFSLETITADVLNHGALIIAVGDTTKAALTIAGIDNIIVPSAHTSEGMLALTQLQDVADKSILIVRGDGGRETLKQQLQHRGANVAYNEVYKRQWLALNRQQTIEKWRKVQINCIVVTSNELLHKTLELTKQEHWLKQCLWIVASARIAEQAMSSGITRVYNADGANNAKIYQAVATVTRSMEVDYD
ncbi:uroporphyrinogen-III synthase [Colwelliaceae bacterium BS250]